MLTPPIPYGLMRHCHLLSTPSTDSSWRPISLKHAFNSWLCYLYGCIGLVLLAAFGCRDQVAKIRPEDRYAIDSITKVNKDISSLKKLQHQFDQEENQLGSIITRKEQGRILRNESRFDEALQIHSEGLRLAEALGDTIEWVQALNEIGTDYRRMGILDVAQEYHYRAYTLSSACSDTTYQGKKNQVISLNGLGNIYMTIGNYEKAEQSFRQALAGEQKLGSAFGQAINYANLGSIFEHQGKVDSAWAYYKHSMELNTKEGSSLGISLCHTYFGALYQKAQQYDKAKQEYLAAYDLMKNSKDEWHALTSLIALAGIYNTTHEDSLCEEFLAKAKAIAERIHSNEHLAEIHALYHSYYSRRGDYRKALVNKEKADALLDSVVSIEKMNRIQNASINIERNRQEQEIAAVQLKLQEEHSKRNITLGISAIVFLALASLVAILLYIQKLRARNHRTLKQMSTLREHFFTNITHEFRTPLTLILGLSHDIQKDPSITTQLQEKARTIERQGSNLLTLINQLLDIARIKSAIGRSDWYNGDITTRLGMLVESYRDYAENRHINLHYTTSGPIVMDFVPDYLDKVINNLLSNALKFTPEDGTIEVKAKQDGSQLKIEISDTGAGISTEALPHIFEPFYQAESNVRHIGIGVGLALVKQIIDAVGGTIEVKSKAGQGTTFLISVPIRHEGYPLLTQTGIVPVAPEIEENPQDSTGGNDCRLLIVEDNPDVAKYVGSILSEHYSIHYAANGREGMERALDLIPDLIITDLMMPEMDGLELCRQIRGNEVVDHIPVIVVTAKVTESERIRGFEAGADAYLSKPFNSDELRALVERQLSRHRSIRLMASQATKSTGEVKPVHPQERENEGAPTPQHSELEQRFLDKANQLINSSLGKYKLEVTALADSLYMSPRQLHRKLVALTGFTPANYILRQKMQRAKVLLSSQPELTIEDVAERCGFEHESSFYHAFKKSYGITPTEYRRGRTEKPL